MATTALREVARGTHDGLIAIDDVEISYSTSYRVFYDHLAVDTLIERAIENRTSIARLGALEIRLDRVKKSAPIKRPELKPHHCCESANKQSVGIFAVCTSHCLCHLGGKIE